MTPCSWETLSWMSCSISSTYKCRWWVPQSNETQKLSIRRSLKVHSVTQPSLTLSKLLSPQSRQSISWSSCKTSMWSSQMSLIFITKSSNWCSWQKCRLSCPRRVNSTCSSICCLWCVDTLFSLTRCSTRWNGPIQWTSTLWVSWLDFLKVRYQR